MEEDPVEPALFAAVRHAVPSVDGLGPAGRLILRTERPVLWDKGAIAADCPLAGILAYESEKDVFAFAARFLQSGGKSRMGNLACRLDAPFLRIPTGNAPERQYPL